jgi:hypothetical protein
LNAAASVSGGKDARLASISASDAPLSDSVSLAAGSRYAKRAGDEEGECRRLMAGMVTEDYKQEG